MKNLKFGFLFLMAMFLMPTCVFAADVSDEASLKQALNDGEKEINLTTDIVLSNDVGTHATRKVGLEVKGEDTITINGNGHTLSSALTVAMEVRANSGKEVKVVLNDITVIGKERAIDIRSAGVTLELNATNLSISGTGNFQALTVGGNSGPITVDINNNSVIDGGKAGYGIITFNPVNMTINDSTVKGYAALYMKEADGSQGSAGSVVTIEDSIIEGNSRYSGYSDNFGAIVLSDKDIDINIKDTVLKSVNTGTAYQVPFLLSGVLTNVSENEKISINLEGDTEIIIDTQIDDESLVLNYDNKVMQVVVNPGVKSNVQIEDEYLAEGTEVVVDPTTGEVTVVAKDNGTQEDTNKGDETTPDKNDEVTTDKKEYVSQVEDNIENPNTSDNILISFILAGLSAVGLSVLAFRYRKFCR